jgi:hypothetical protein
VPLVCQPACQHPTCEVILTDAILRFSYVVYQFCHEQKALRRTSSWDPPAVQSQPLARAASDYVPPPAAAVSSSSSGSPERASHMPPCQE